MQDEILKSRPVLINLDQGLTFESIFENYASDNIKVKIIPANIGTDEPMEIIIREIKKPFSFEGKTGTYAPKGGEVIKFKKQKKGHIVDRIIKKAL